MDKGMARLSKKRILVVASINAIIAGLAMPAAAWAQDQAPAAASEVRDDIVVTGTRVVRDGYNAPTPVTVIDASAIASKAAANIADFVNELPSLTGSTSPRANISSIGNGLAGLNALNLRNLGAVRTLVLLDGQRVAASHLTGLVDINQFPESLVSRVDVVTGGASAGWGSDAVSGVVNFILDKKYTGLKGEIQGGVTNYGDGRNYKVSLTAGTSFADDRGHLLVAAEHAYNQGIRGLGKRKWYNRAKIFNNPAYTATNGQPRLLALPNVGFSTATPGGVITAGPLRGTYFGEGGTPAQLNYGPIVSDPAMQGGDSAYSDFGDSGDLDPQLTRQNLFVRTSYDVTDSFQLFAQGSYGRAASHYVPLTEWFFGNLTMQADNAFLPASVAARAAALGVTSFSYGTTNQDLPVEVNTNRKSWRGVIGANGDFDGLGTSWTWDAYVQRGKSNSYIGYTTGINANYRNAIDAVRNSNGAIVCRSTLTNPTNGCVPYNLFGTGVNSEAALNYVRGTAFLRTRLTQDVAAATLRGNPLSTWAGPVSIAAGVEHRREKVSSSTDPLSPTRGYFAGNFVATFGSYTVNEAFFETVVPLLKEVPLAEILDISAAVRATDYSTTGYVTTWKVGATYSPVEDISFRVTQSRDIRAPNLAELFQAGQTLTTTISDPFRNNASTTLFQVTSGNRNLKPEKANSFGAGVIVKPRFLPGFAASVDYYRIKIKDSIATVNAATLVNQCFLGNTQFCSQITRNSSNVITQVSVLPVNVAKQIASGLDFEASYRRPVMEGNLTLRILATRFLKNYTNDGITPPTDTVGTNGVNGTLRNSLPRWRYVASVGWDQDPVQVTLSARGISSGVYNTSYIECTTACPTSTVANMTINDNHVPGAIYFDTNITVKLPNQIEAYLAVDNIANKDPAQVAFGPSIGQAPISVNALLYDVVGRSFRVGLRFKM